MRRRESIALLGGVTAALPFAARGQQQTVPVIGFLSVLSPSDMSKLVDAFREGLVARNQIPTMYFQSAFAEIGGLISYATNYAERYRQIASTPAEFSKAQSLRTCRSCSRPSSSCSSTSRLQRRSASTYHQRCSPARTRRSNSDALPNREGGLVQLGGFEPPTS
jgi:hypothetical protein